MNLEEKLMVGVVFAALAAFVIIFCRVERRLDRQAQEAHAVLASAEHPPAPGPSRARYRQLLHECREANREHLRMLEAYDAEASKSATDCTKVTGQVVGDEWICTEPFAAPAQKSGSVEFGLGGL